MKTVPAAFTAIRLLATALLCGGATAVRSEEVPEVAHTLMLTVENDRFAGTDRHYTNGVRLGYIASGLVDYESLGAPGWSLSAVTLFPFVDRPGTTHSFSIAIGQNIYTPEEIRRTDLIEDDRPYAGWLYLTLGFESKDLQRSDALELQLGVIGPAALGEDAQRTVHGQTGSDKPRGWDHQLENEPAVNITYERRNRLLRFGGAEGLNADLLINFGGSLGNVHTYANAGTTLRFGWNVPRNFGMTLIRPRGGSFAPVDADDPRIGPTRRRGFYLSAGVDGRAIARNIFLDGNTFEDSHSVDKKHFRADFYAGAVAIIPPWTISYLHVYRTKEFDGQDSAQRFGSLTVAFSF